MKSGRRKPEYNSLRKVIRSSPGGTHPPPFPLRLDAFEKWTKIQKASPEHASLIIRTNSKQISTRYHVAIDVVVLMLLPVIAGQHDLTK